jgi:hypothetical protein
VDAEYGAGACPRPHDSPGAELTRGDEWTPTLSSGAAARARTRALRAVQTNSAG